MSEFRQDATTGRWVIIAPERGRRPGRERTGARPAGGPAPRFDPTCPFCPGNEHLLPGIIEETPGAGSGPWGTRVVPNKFPALDSQAGTAGFPEAQGPVQPGYGVHEVIVETPRHDAELAARCANGLTAVAETYRRRLAALMAAPAIEAVLVFRNHGPAGGASLRHPHSQVIATPVVPPRLAQMVSWGRARYQEQGECVTCAELARALDDGSRVVEATDRFAALVPFAAENPFELWILPRRHVACFADAETEHLAALGALLGRALRRMESALAGPSYNFAIESAPAGHAGAPYFHWRLRIVPNLRTPGGFELGGGLAINPSSPEEDAAALRSAQIAA